MLPEDLKKERLEAFAAEDFSEIQQVFLRAMRVATGMITDDATLHNKGKIFILMAKIGNTQKLQEWSAKEGLEILNEYKRWALLLAAEKGRLLCVQYLRSHLDPNISHAKPLIFNITVPSNQNAHQGKQEGDDNDDARKSAKTSSCSVM